MRYPYIASSTLSTAWFLISLLAPPAATADVIRDGSLGPGAATQPTGPDYLIDQTMGELHGTNLFHSFQEFNLNPSQSATFTATSPVDNVVSRITGGSPSTIDGTLSSTIGNANFYFINPYGVVFGQNAQINVTGDFYASTADQLTLGDGTLWDTTGSTSTLLSTAPPQAFGFSGATLPAQITVDNATLQFTPGTGVALIGGEITIFAGSAPVITTAGGELQLISINSAAQVDLAGNVTGNNISYGNITLQGAGVDPVFVDPALDVSGTLGGTILMRGDNIDISHFSVAAHTLGDTAGNPIGIDLFADNQLTLSGLSQVSSISEAAGKAGDISIVTDTLVITDDGEILSDAFGSAQGSQLSITGRKVVLSGDAELASDVEGSGGGGQVVISAETITIGESSEISSDTAGSGAGGNVTLTASRGIYILEEGGIFTDSQTAANGGDISISAPELIIQGVTSDPAVAAAADISMGIFSLNSGSGDAGNISIAANTTELRDGASISALSAGGDGGNIAIQSSEQLLLRDSEITANVNNGVGGNIDLSSALVAIHDSRVVAQAGAGQGGAIVIDSERFFLSESLISASAGPAGISGTVETPPKVDLVGGLTPLDTQFLDVQSLFQGECEARTSGESLGKFTVIPPRARPASSEGILLAAAEDLSQDSAIPSFNDPELSELFALRQRLKSDHAKVSTDELQAALSSLEKLADGTTKVYALIHLAMSYQQLFENSAHQTPALLLSAFSLLKRARLLAIQYDSPRGSAFASGNLARLYLTENRYSEALLLARQAIQSAYSAGALSAAYRWHWLEGQVLWAIDAQGQAIEAYSKAVSIISASRHEALVDEELAYEYFEQEIIPVYMDLLNALLLSAKQTPDSATRASLLLRTRQTIENFKAAELRDYYQDPCIASLQAKTRSLDEVIGSAAVVYPIILADRVEILLTLPATQDGTSNLHLFTAEVSAARLEREAELFRLSMSRTNTQAYLRHANNLYDWLVRPYRELLHASQIETLVFVPDGILRTIPMAALHDGKQFLIEEFSTAIAPGLELVDPRPIDLPSTSLLLAGLSQSVSGYPALPKVPEELGFIQYNFAAQSSTTLLDSNFQLEKIQASLLNDRPSIVHIASHAEFGGSHDDNFVLTSDGRMTMNHLAKFVGVARFRQQPIELLVLSACETAEGDADAALGLAGVAIQAGARSAIGSLWRISDDATYKLVSHFYSELSHNHVSKARALQEAQLRLLADPLLHHPYYWSPYILISNWL